MRKTALCRRAASVSFWDGYAPWYRLWMEHTRYHDRVLDLLLARAAPGWKVLDVGCGNGVLSLPLCGIGCEVTALEPSIGMRNLLYEEAFRRSVDWLTVDERRWEATMSHEFYNHDLIMACNSLHLTSIGFDAALELVFRAGPKRILIVSETHPALTMPRSSDAYEAVVETRYEVESSFAYHTVDEARAHWALKKGRSLSLVEEFELEEQIAEREKHLVIRDSSAVTMSWWERRESATDRRFWNVCAAIPAGAGGEDHGRAA